MVIVRISAISRLNSQLYLAQLPVNKPNGEPNEGLGLDKITIIMLKLLFTKIR